jgi:hypothetical protein
MRAQPPTGDGMTADLAHLRHLIDGIDDRLLGDVPA